MEEESPAFAATVEEPRKEGTPRLDFHEEAARSQVPALPGQPASCREAAPPRFHPHLGEPQEGLGACWGPNRPGAAIWATNLKAPVHSRSRPDGAVRGFSNQALGACSAPRSLQSLPNSASASVLCSSALGFIANRLVLLPGHPQAVHEDSQLACHGGCGTPFRALATAAGQLQSPTARRPGTSTLHQPAREVDQPRSTLHQGIARLGHSQVRLHLRPAVLHRCQQLRVSSSQPRQPLGIRAIILGVVRRDELEPPWVGDGD